MSSSEMDMWFEGLEVPDRNSWLALSRGEQVTFDPAATMPLERISPAPGWWVTVEADRPVDVGFMVEGTMVGLSDEFRAFLESKLK